MKFISRRVVPNLAGGSNLGRRKATFRKWGTLSPGIAETCGPFSEMSGRSRMNVALARPFAAPERGTGDACHNSLHGPGRGDPVALPGTGRSGRDVGPAARPEGGEGGHGANAAATMANAAIRPPAIPELQRTDRIRGRRMNAADRRRPGADRAGRSAPGAAVCSRCARPSVGMMI